MVKKTPLQQLTFSDRAALKNFINYQSIGGELDIDKIFRYWDKSKRKLYKMLGYKLRRSFPIHIEPDSSFLLLSEFPNIYSNPTIACYISDTKSLQEWIYKEKNFFIKTFFQHMLDLYNQDKISWQIIYDFSTMLKHYAVIYGYTRVPYNFEYKNKKFKVDRHMKIMRAIRKSLDFFEYPYMDLFEPWRDKVSVALSLKNMDAKVTLSIHPIDLLSLSDNNSNWKSCLAWSTDGSYKYGTLEMLNSNMALVAYIENTSSDYTFCRIKTPNKLWRSLFFVDKNIMLAGKDYPFNNTYLQKQIMDIILKLAEENLGYTYKYQKQWYYDVRCYQDNDDCVECMHYYQHMNWHHKIITYMNNCMYNDFIDSDWVPLCCRNYVDKTKYINLSGPITCLSCGDLISDEQIEDDYLWCDKCRTHWCWECDRNNRDYNHYMVKAVDKWSIGTLIPRTESICEECLIVDYWYLEKLQAFISKKNYLDLRKKIDLVNNDKILPVTKELLKEKVKEV